MDTAEVLKQRLPLYPVVKRIDSGMNDRVSFSTLIRRRFHNQDYYLKIITVSGTNEAKTIHELHSTVYKSLMLEVLNKDVWVIDNDQVNEVKRLQ